MQSRCSYHVVRQQLGSLVVARAHADVVLLVYDENRKSAITRLVVVRETPVDDVHLLRDVVDQNVLRLDVAVHDATAVRIVQSLDVNSNRDDLQRGSCRSSNVTRNPKERGSTPDHYLHSEWTTRKSFVSTHFVMMLGAFVSGFITMPSN